VKLARYLTLAAFIALLAGCHKSQQIELKTVPLLELKGDVTLRVVHAINPRLPRFSRAQLETLLFEASRAVREHFAVTVHFSIVGEVGTDQLFNTIPAKLWRIAQYNIYDFKSGRGDAERLAKSFGEVLAKNNDAPGDLVHFSGTRLGHLAGKDHAEIGRELARIQLEGLSRWKEVTAPDGRSVIDLNPYNETAFWDVLGHAGLPYDIVITNQLVASAEYGSTDVHSALRGGMSQGMTTYNKNSALGSYIFVSTFAVTATDSWVLELRGGESYSKKEMARLLAYVLAHEIGHQLFHFGHPFGRTECVMNPTYLLYLRRWVQKLSPGQCALGSHPAMVPDARKILYVDWSQYP